VHCVSQTGIQPLRPTLIRYARQVVVPKAGTIPIGVSKVATGGDKVNAARPGAAPGSYEDERKVRTSQSLACDLGIRNVTM